MLLYMNILKKFVNCLDASKESYSVSESKELLRHALCIGLGLPSVGANKRVSEEAICISKELFNDLDVDSWTLEYKQGVLEACLKCFERVMRGGKS